MAAKRGETRRRIEQLLPLARERQWSQKALAEAAGISYDNLRYILWTMRRAAEAAGEPDPWPSDDSRLRETYLNDLLAVASVRPTNIQAWELRMLRQLSRLEQGLSISERRTVILNFKQRLLDSNEVVDLRREDAANYRKGDVFLRPARPGEEGSIIARE